MGRNKELPHLHDADEERRWMAVKRETEEIPIGYEQQADNSPITLKKCWEDCADPMGSPKEFPPPQKTKYKN